MYNAIIDYPTDPIMRQRIIERFKKITDTPEFKASVAKAMKQLGIKDARKTPKSSDWTATNVEGYC